MKNSFLKQHISVFFAIIAIVFIFVLGTSQKQEDSTLKEASLFDASPIAQLIEGKTEGEALRAIAETEGIEVAWQYLKEKYAHKPADAHNLAHVIGYLAYEQNEEKGFSICDWSFAFGCYHGLVEMLIAEKGSDGVLLARDGCNTIKTKGGISSCLHGIGHGLLAWEGYNLPQSLARCDVLSVGERTYCYDGIFMENITGLMRSPQDPHWYDLAEKLYTEPHWPCNIVDKKYQEACYYEQPSALLGLFGIGETGKICQESGREELANQCIRGIGIRVGQMANGSPKDAVDLCNLIEAEESKYLCVTNSAKEFAFQRQTEDKVSIICSSLPPLWATSCQNEVNYLRSLYEDGENKNQRILKGTYREIDKIFTSNNLKEQIVLYRTLIERVGAEEAQEALLRSGLPFTGETHLLNHEVGYFLYEKEGAKGLMECKDYFLSSCYHGVLVKAMGDNGLLSLSKVMESCKKSDWTVVPQCAHAIGHGLLAWSGYKNLPETLALCDKVESEVEDFPVYNCHDGVFMENNYAVHLGAPSPDRWIKYDDPFYPCNDSRIEEKYRKACWSNQPQLQFEQFGGDIRRLGALCEGVKNEEYRVTCFNSIARHIHSFTFGNVEVAFNMCANLANEQYVHCLTDVLTLL